MMHLVCYLRDGDRVLETYGRQELWEDSPPGWPQEWQLDGSNTRIDGRPIAQWSRIEAGSSDDLMAGP